MGKSCSVNKCSIRHSTMLLFLLLMAILKPTATFVVNGNETDLEALLQFKAKISGDQLGIMRSWNNSVHFCQWRGVKCSQRHQRVTKLDLRTLRLMGSISPFIGNLSFLRVLNLQNNSFSLGVPQEIGRLRRLQELTLDRNFISGEIPSNLSGCSKLRRLYIGHNLLAGEIPATLSRLSSLEELGFSNNTLSGSIPPSLGNLTSLGTIYLSLNRFTGVIPESLGQLNNLTILSVAENKISGTVPSSLFNLSNIRILDIGENNFQGSLPSQLGFNMPYLQIFSVSLNQLSGPFPLSITNASNLITLQVVGNKFTGNMSSFRKLEKLQSLNIADNLLGSQGTNDLKFLCSLTNTTSLEFVDMSDNSFGGVLPECISNLSAAITVLAMQGNHILGRIPEGIGNLINLEVLVAGENQLSGSIPSAIGRLPKLQLFAVNVNSISGGIPSSLGNLKMLIKLYLNDNNLQGNIPPSLGKCVNLVLLDLSNNNLSGSIPSQIAGLSSLSIGLALSSNRLTGVLPSEVGNLRNLGILDVSQNMLSGVIPNDLGNCISLELLLMRGNFFQGSIPSSLSSLRGLAHLDISNNNLTGEIPKFLVNFNSLLYLNLSHNDFEGVVPVDGVFKNVSATFLEGNNKLCGGTPQFHLPACDRLKQHRRRSPISLKLIIAIVSALLGVILVFYFIFGFWFRKKRKRLTSPNAENPCLRLSYQMILKATNGFSSANLVGTGSFGFVYKGVLEENRTIIAVKVFKLLSHGASRSFMAECEALRNVRHRNLVKILTVCSGLDYQGNGFKALVYEFMANGSLEDWLHPPVGMNEAEAAKSLNIFQRLNVAIDVGCALEYLHHYCETPIVHCDLKPSNILLDDKMVGHVSDFGLAKFITSDVQNNTSSLSSSLGLRGTIGYAPPEYGLGSDVTTYGDVYSYGILLLEMFTGRRPTDEMFKENLNLHNFVKTALPNRVAEIIDPILLQEGSGEETMINNTCKESNLKDNRHLFYLNSIFEIGVACSVELPNQRICMTDVVAELCSIREKLLPTRSSRPTGTR
ncbi:probable LRR receptor-like serine/threonine-protein kinase At3g47570 isoform X2 [Herrania umbratica]|uniref:non-specific serine/threonine protein kinase n=1 Tax=Herrania umbratica TaxID=108875 RepID=A0A6J1A722_9ROSI|nr:probable LRR receptor-like serine/threonine-protein kinase At3g47570 isoform X2 [Herrania umbratica]